MTPWTCTRGSGSARWEGPARYNTTVTESSAVLKRGGAHWLDRRAVTQEAAGSSPVAPASFPITSLQFARPGRFQKDARELLCLQTKNDVSIRPGRPRWIRRKKAAILMARGTTEHSSAPMDSETTAVQQVAGLFTSSDDVIAFSRVWLVSSLGRAHRVPS